MNWKMFSSTTPDLVILRHFSQEFEKETIENGLGNESLFEWIEKYKEKWRDVNSRIAKNFLGIIGLKEFRVSAS